MLPEELGIDESLSAEDEISSSEDKLSSIPNVNSFMSL